MVGYVANRPCSQDMRPHSAISWPCHFPGTSVSVSGNMRGNTVALIHKCAVTMKEYHGGEKSFTNWRALWPWVELGYFKGSFATQSSCTCCCLGPVPLQPLHLANSDTSFRTPVKYLFLQEAYLKLLDRVEFPTVGSYCALCVPSQLTSHF